MLDKLTLAKAKGHIFFPNGKVSYIIDEAFIWIVRLSRFQMMLMSRSSMFNISEAVFIIVRLFSQYIAQQLN